MILTRILAYCCHIQSMAEMNDEFNKDLVIRNISDIFNCKLENLPHGDTINLLFKRLNVQDLKDLLTSLVKHMIENRSLERYRAFNEYYQIVIDGSQLYCFNQEHVKYCLTRTHSDGTKTFHTQVLVAYLVVGENLVIPIDFEFLENEPENVKKQDCEINAAKRLLKRIKKNYPRLKILLNADALYANQVIMSLCEKNHWKYIIRFKEGCIDSLLEEYEEHKVNEYAEVEEEIIIKNNEIKSNNTYTYVNKLIYQDHVVNIAELEIDVKDKKTTFVFITNIEINQKNIKEIIGRGRKRWKIENKGFNDEKNHGYGMCHAYSYHANAVKCHYALLLISHLFMQLLEHYMKTKGNPKKIMELGKEIKEALRFAHLNAQDYVEILTPIQIRHEIPY